MTYIVAYDIEDDRIRGKLARFLEQNGVRLQKSVFVLDLERHVVRRFLSDVKKLVGDAGDVAVFPLCRGCRDKALRLRPCENPLYVF